MFYLKIANCLLLEFFFTTLEDWYIVTSLIFRLQDTVTRLTLLQTIISLIEKWLVLAGNWICCMKDTSLIGYMYMLNILRNYLIY